MVGGLDDDAGCARWSASARVGSTTRWATSTRLTSSRSSTAAPASNRLISSRSASSVSNRSSSVCSSSAERAVAGSKSPRASCSTSPAIRTVVSGVRSSWETSETNRRWTRLSSSSWRIWRCRLVAIWLNDVASRARSSSPRDPHPLLEPAGGQPLGDPPGQPDRRDDLPGDQPGERRRPGPAAATAAVSSARVTSAEGLLLLVEREQVVERVDAAVGRAAGPASRPRSRAPTARVVVGVRMRGVGPRRVGRPRRSAARATTGTLASVEAAGEARRRRRSMRRPAPTGPASTTLEPARAAALR